MNRRQKLTILTVYFILFATAICCINQIQDKTLESAERYESKMKASSVADQKAEQIPESHPESITELIQESKAESHEIKEESSHETVSSSVSSTVTAEKKTAEKPKYKEITVVATAYCPCEKCCGKWALNRPLDENGNPIIYTASGARAKPGCTLSVDPKVIPYGTKVIMDGKTYIAQDCGGGIKGNRIDVYFATHEEAWNFGKKKISVKIEV